MKFYRSALAALAAGAMLACAAFPSAAAEGGKFLADRHMARGVVCVSCHGTQSPQPGAKVKTENCNACHQSLDAVAKRTAKVDPNPHYNHLVGLDCVECHKGHRQSVNMCAGCHNIHYKVP